jgi:hypothetical protein
MTTVISSDHLIGSVPVGLAIQRKGYPASLPAEHSAGRRVSARTSASNAWNQNWNSSNPGNQNNNNKTNANRVRAVRRPGAMRDD